MKAPSIKPPDGEPKKIKIKVKKGQNAPIPEGYKLNKEKSTNNKKIYEKITTTEKIVPPSDFKFRDVTDEEMARIKAGTFYGPGVQLIGGKEEPKKETSTSTSTLVVKQKPVKEPKVKPKKPVSQKPRVSIGEKIRSAIFFAKAMKQLPKFANCGSITPRGKMKD